MSPAASKKGAAPADQGDRALEVLAVLLLAIATIGSAWCGYQATRWNTEQGELSQEALDAQVEGAQLFGLATQVVSYDSNMVAQYAKAIVDGDEELADFLRETLIRPGFLPTLDRWEEELADGEAPTNLLADEAYLEEQLGEYRATQARSEAATVESEEAGQNGDDYVLATLLFASALFFAGVTTSFNVRFARILMLASSAMILAYTAARLSEYPLA